MPCLIKQSSAIQLNSKKLGKTVQLEHLASSGAYNCILLILLQLLHPLKFCDSGLDKGQ